MRLLLVEDDASLGKVLVRGLAEEGRAVDHVSTVAGAEATFSVNDYDLVVQVWDANYDGLSNVVDVHIANLRRKLDLQAHPNPVETVRGVGYRVATSGRSSQ